MELASSSLWLSAAHPHATALKRGCRPTHTCVPDWADPDLVAALHFESAEGRARVPRCDPAVTRRRDGPRLCGQRPARDSAHRDKRRGADGPIQVSHTGAPCEESGGRPVVGRAPLAVLLLGLPRK